MVRNGSAITISPKERKLTVPSMLDNAASTIAGHTSMHGFAWHNRTQVRSLRMLMTLVLLAVVISLPVVIIIEVVDFFGYKKAIFSQEMIKVDNLLYPVITLCHPKFFDKRKLQAMNINDEMASYMISALDESSSTQDFMISHFGGSTYKEILARLDLDLNETIARQNMTDLLQLFHAVAINCEDFLFLCDDHSRLSFTGSSSLKKEILSNCCNTLFDSKPFFTSAGTCFSSKVRHNETVPATINAIKIWMAKLEETTPDMAMHLLGTQATERSGAFWSVSDADLPARVLYQEPKQVRAGTAVTVGLSAQFIDRTGMTSFKCASKNETFERIFGVNFTQGNCELMTRHFMHPKCSYLVYSGLPSPDPRLYPCLPNDVLENHYSALSTNRVGYHLTDCTRDCKEMQYLKSITTGEMDVDTINSFLDILNSTYPRLHKGSTMSIKFYFETFDVQNRILYNESLVSFLSRIGGWMGLAIGASAISIFEILGFMCYFICTYPKKYFQN